MAIAYDWGGFNGTVSDASITVSTTTLTSASNPWVSSDVGKSMIVTAAGPGSTTLFTYIASFNNAGSVELGTAAGTSASNTTAFWFVGQYKTGSAITSLTWKHVCTGSNRYLVVPVWAAGASSFPDGATYNGVAMTLLDQYCLSDKGAQLWGLVNPASGMNDVVVTYSGAAIAYACTSVSYTGVNQSTPVGTPAHAGTGGGGAMSISVNVSSAVGELVVDCLASFAKTYTRTPTGTGQVLESSLIAGAGDFSGANGALDSCSTTGAATTTVSYSFSGTDYANITAIPLKPSGAGR